MVCNQVIIQLIHRSRTHIDTQFIKRGKVITDCKTLIKNVMKSVVKSVIKYKLHQSGAMLLERLASLGNHMGVHIGNPLRTLEEHHNNICDGAVLHLAFILIIPIICQHIQLVQQKYIQNTR